jgi:hypothetical protein
MDKAKTEVEREDLLQQGKAVAKEGQADHQGGQAAVLGARRAEPGPKTVNLRRGQKTAANHLARQHNPR